MPFLVWESQEGRNVRELDRALVVIGRDAGSDVVIDKGNGTFMESRGSLKRSRKVDLNHFVKGRHLGGRAVLNLHSCVTDASWMNEVLAYQFYRDASVPAPRTAYARVYLTVPGLHDRVFLGLYSLVENVDRHFLEHNFGTKRWRFAQAGHRQPVHLPRGELGPLQSDL